MSYYNTTNLNGKELSKLQQEAINQDDIIYSIFQQVINASPWELYILINYPDTTVKWKSLSAAIYHIRTFSEERIKAAVRHVAAKEKYPITSIRRSISNLTDKKMILQTQIKRTGPHGRKEYLWRIY
jgi:hypothetical protein